MGFLRVIVGMAHGVIIPASTSILAKWAPPLERSRLAAFMSAGHPIGNALGMVVPGLLCDFAGWKIIFYVSGILGILFCIVWSLFIHDSAAESPYTSEVEKSYILT